MAWLGGTRRTCTAGANRASLQLLLRRSLAGPPPAPWRARERATFSLDGLLGLRAAHLGRAGPAMPAAAAVRLTAHAGRARAVIRACLTRFSGLGGRHGVQSGARVSHGRRPALPSGVRVRRLSSRPQGTKSARYQEEMRKKNRQLALYMGGLTLFTISFTYLSVPLYRIFCAKTGFAGTVKPQDQVRYEEKAKPVSGRRVLTVKFNADTSITMPWKFLPDQHEVKVLPGEAALAFFTAENKTNEPIIGVASYNIQPEGAALYFNKIQCFCFEEQMLKAREKVDMPVFFFIDPDFLADKGMDQVDTITLSYTFFKAGDADAPEVAGLHVPVLPARQKSTVGTSATDH